MELITMQAMLICPKMFQVDLVENHSLLPPPLQKQVILVMVGKLYQ